MNSERSREAPRVRFASLRVEYGRHRETFSFPDRPAPVVVAGANGSGKTTLIEALVRTLYGFNRRQADDRSLHDGRRPWAGDGYRAELTLQVGDETFFVEREFNTHRVRVRGEPGGREIFNGEANPGSGDGGAIVRYREWLSGTLGFARFHPYVSTAYIRQGDLRETAVTDELLRIAAGGHASIDPARESVREAYHSWTIEPIADRESRRRKAGVIERLTESVTRLEAELGRARSADLARKPLVQERGALRERLRKVEQDIARLEAALGPLADRRGLTAELREARSRVQALERLADELRQSAASLEARTAEWSVAVGGAQYPADFAERTAAVGELWRDLERGKVERRKVERGTLVESGVSASPGDGGAPTGISRNSAHRAVAAKLSSGAAPIAGGVALLVAGTALLVTGHPSLGLALMLPGGLLTAAGLASRGRHRRDAERAAAQLRHLSERDSEIRTRISELLRDVPDADTLTPSTLPERRDRFERQRAARAARDEAQHRLDEVEERAAREIEAHDREEGGAGGLEPRDEAGDRRTRELGTGETGTLLDRVGHAVVEARNRVATLELALRRTDGGGLPLPEGIPEEAAGVEAALEERRGERADLERRLAEVVSRLGELGVGQATPVALETRLQAEREQLAEARAQAQAHRLAFALLEDGYEAFRADDQQRLLASISARLEALTGGALGPLESGAGLDAARLRAFGRSVAVESPPLSYGELHAVLLAVRIGAADFLSGFGIVAPILIDEPFLHLDASRAAQVWATLCAASRDRQVLVATGDRLMLEHLGITPDIELPDRGARELRRRRHPRSHRTPPPDLATRRRPGS